MYKKLTHLISLILILFLFGCSTNTRLSMADVYSGYYSIANEYVKLENIEKALEYYEKALPGYEDSNEIKYKLAYYSTLTKNYINAEKYFLELLSMDSQNSTIKSSLAYIYCKQEKYDQAITLYSEILEQNAFDEISFKNYILLTEFIGQKEEAESLVQKYIEKFPKDETIYTLLQKEEETENTDESEEGSNTDEVDSSTAENKDLSVENPLDTSENVATNDAATKAE